MTEAYTRSQNCDTDPSTAYSHRQTKKSLIFAVSHRENICASVLGRAGIRFGKADNPPDGRLALFPNLKFILRSGPGVDVIIKDVTCPKRVIIGRVAAKISQRAAVEPSETGRFEHQPECGSANSTRPSSHIDSILKDSILPKNHKASLEQ
jgi:hypothetical protein